MPIDYKEGKIYKIVNTDNTLVYIGSTTQSLAQRRAKHMSNYKRWKAGISHYVTSYKIIDDDKEACIILLESYPCNSKEELESRERHHIDTMNCVNKRIPGRTKKEYYEDTKDKMITHIREYYTENRDKILSQKKKYGAENKDKIALKRKEF